MSQIKSENNNNNNSSSNSSSNDVNGHHPGHHHQEGPEVVPVAKRRQFSASEKERILAEADACSQPGEIGALLRREGIYSSYLTSWRREREQGQGLSPQKRGRKGASVQDKELARLQAENARLKAQLERAETIIEVQKKVSDLFGMSLNETKRDGDK